MSSRFMIILRGELDADVCSFWPPRHLGRSELKTAELQSVQLCDFHSRYAVLERQSDSTRPRLERPS